MEDDEEWRNGWNVGDTPPMAFSRSRGSGRQGWWLTVFAVAVPRLLQRRTLLVKRLCFVDSAFGDEHLYWSRHGVRGFAGVVSGVLRSRLRYGKLGLGSFHHRSSTSTPTGLSPMWRHNRHPSLCVVVYHSLVVIPKHVLWGRRCFLDHADEWDLWSPIDVILISSQDKRLWCDNFQLNLPRYDACVCWYLTLVVACVSLLNKLYLQDPVIRPLFVEHLKPGVGSVCQHAVCQNVPIPQSDPWYCSVASIDGTV